MINRALRGLVQSRQGLTSRIGDRFYGNVIPQGVSTYPLAYHRPIGSPRRHTFDGLMDLQQTSTDVFIYAKTQTDLEELLSLFESELDGQRGNFNGVHIYDVRVHSGGGQDWSDDHQSHVGRLELTITIRR